MTARPSTSSRRRKPDAYPCSGPTSCRPFGSIQLAQIEPLLIQEWVADLLGDGLWAARVRQAYQVLAASLKSAVQSGYLARSPAIGIQLPRVTRREMRFLTPAEVSRLSSVSPLI